MTLPDKIRATVAKAGAIETGNAVCLLGISGEAAGKVGASIIRNVADTAVAALRTEKMATAVKAVARGAVPQFANAIANAIARAVVAEVSDEIHDRVKIVVPVGVEKIAADQKIELDKLDGLVWSVFNRVANAVYETVESEIAAAVSKIVSVAITNAAITAAQLELAASPASPPKTEDGT